MAIYDAELARARAGEPMAPDVERVYVEYLHALHQLEAEAWHIELRLPGADISREIPE